MVRLLRLLRGYVVFAVTGSYPEKFINICTFNGVNVWGVKSREGVVYCCTLASNYKTVRILSRRTSAKIRVKRKRGLPFILLRNKKRSGLLIGAVLFIAILKILSMFVWTVDISGSENISYNYAKDVMKQVGVYEGVYGNFESLTNIRTKALLSFENVSWLSVNVDGSYGEVSMSESVQKGNITDNSLPSNIKAECDAQILRVDAYSGSPAVKSGDAVVKGNLLISGVIENELGGISLVNSDGVVWARTERVENLSLKKKQSFTDCSDKLKCRYSFRLFNMIIPISYCNLDCNNNYFYFTDERKAEFNEKTASISLIKQSILDYDKQSVNINKIDVEKQLKAEIMLTELFSYNDKKIINRSIETEIDEDCYKYNIMYVCEEDIGIKSEILTDDQFKIDNESLENSDTDSEE